MSALGDKQERFTILLAQLIVWAYEQGYKIRMGDVYAAGGHKKNSNHYIKLAADLNLFKNGIYQSTTEAHTPLGEKWKSLAPDCCWGGDFQEKDGNHYSLEFDGRR